MYVARLSCCHSLVHLKVELIELVNLYLNLCLHRCDDIAI